MRKGLAEALPQTEFIHLLNDVEARLREMGVSIFSGAAAVDPYRKGSATACDYCDYRPVCRIDPWTHSWRVLRAEKQSAEEDGAMNSTYLSLSPGRRRRKESLTVHVSGLIECVRINITAGICQNAGGVYSLAPRI